MSNNDTEIDENSKKSNMVWIICTILFVCTVFGGIALAKSKGLLSDANSSSATDATDTDAPVTDAKSTQITVKWQGKEYTGIYNGKMKNEKPHGKGVFVSDDEKLTYSGAWKKGKFDGSGKITYIDGSYEKGSYEGGKRHGMIKEYENENTYTVARYNENTLYGCRIYYEDGVEAKTKWYYKGKTLKSIEKKAIELTPEVISDKSYNDKTVYVEGTVCFSGETAESEYFRIDTDSIGMVIGSYSNSLGKYLKQVNMPTLKVGDKVRIYGTFSDISKCCVFKDSDAYGYEYPVIKPISGYVLEEAPKSEETVETDKSDKNDSDEKREISYQELLNTPYENYTRWVSGKYVVKEVIRIGKKLYLISYPKDQADLDESQQELYTLFFNSSDDEIIKSGDIIKVSGYLDGQYKKIKDEDKESYYQNEDKQYVLSEKNSGIKVDYSQTVFTYEYDIYPAIHVFKRKKK